MDRRLEIEKYQAFRISAKRDSVVWHLFATARAAGKRPALQAVKMALRHAGFDIDPEVIWSGRLADLSIDAVTDAALSEDALVTLGEGAYADLTTGAVTASLEECSIASVNALDAQLHVHPRKQVPDELTEFTFGGPLACYALIDGAAMPQAVDTLSQSGLHYTCLFKGRAAQDYAETAPYLVHLEPTNPLTRRLFTSIPNDKLGRGLWDTGCATFLRSAASLEALAGHFRKYTCLIDPASGKSVFFRFYAPETMRTVVGNMTHADRETFTQGINTLFCTNGRGGVWGMSRKMNVTEPVT